MLTITSQGGNHTTGQFITVITNNISSVGKKRLLKFSHRYYPQADMKYFTEAMHH
jgi:hypothetical protein